MSQIDISQWKEFKITDFYQPIVVPNKIHKIDMYDDLTIPVFSAGGFQGFVDHADFKPQTHYLLFGDQTCTFFYIDYPFSVMDNVKVLKPLADISLNQSLFIQTVAMRALGNIGYSRYWSILKKKVFQLPVDTNGNPDWQYMDTYIAKLTTLAHKNVSSLNQIKAKPSKINIDHWGEFKLSELFEPEFTDGDNKIGQLEEDDTGINLIGPLNSNNGILGKFISNTKIFPKNTLTWDMFGTCYWQKEPYQTVSHGHVLVLNPKVQINSASLLYLATILTKLGHQKQFGYTNMLTINKYNKLYVKLPIDAKGKPDWEYMSNQVCHFATLSNLTITSLRSVI